MAGVWVVRMLTSLCAVVPPTQMFDPQLIIAKIQQAMGMDG